MSHARRHSLAIALAIGMIASTAAQAAQFVQRDHEFPPREYTCRFEGADLPLGAHRCLKTPQGQRFGECRVTLNMSTWATRADTCP